MSPYIHDFGEKFMKNLSLKFLSQMEKILGDDYSKFLDCFEKNPVKALRVNSLLVKNMDEFVKNFPFETEKLNFLDNIQIKNKKI